jgi:ferrous iron transport protein B
MTKLEAAAGPEAASRPTTVCLVGMPNSGKTTLMNALTGGHFHTANYPGVTVSLMQGKSSARWGEPLTVVDLPGVHSAIDPSPEEELSCRVIESRHEAVEADAFALVIDATQLERHLKFAGFVARQGKPVVLVLTMMDLLERVHDTVDPEDLSRKLGLPVIPVDSRKGEGIGELVETLRNAVSDPAAPSALTALGDEPVEAYRRVRELLGTESQMSEVDGLHLLVERDSLTASIDRIALHRVLGFPLFLVILVGLFWSIFWLADPFMGLVESVFTFSGDLVTRLFPDSIVARFVSEGLIGGVGAVAVFLPQIIILFFLMTLLEDSGYLARGATLVDRPLSALGLHGRSFVPMLSGFACAIPAVFAARSIPTLRERLLTIWIIPLMSCSARLPVYALLLAALLPDAAASAGLALAAIYVASLLIGSLSAGVVGRIAFANQPPSLLAMELPVYRVPRWKIILRMTWARSSTYLRKAGGPIVVIAIVLWVLSSFGMGGNQPQFAGVDSPPLVAQAEMDASFAAQLGQFTEPVLRPMGVDWRVGVGLISAFAAREVFVSAMAIVFHVEGEDEDTQVEGLRETMRSATFADTGEPIFTTSSMIGLIVFFFFSLQCISTVAVVRRETNSWRFTTLQLLFYTGLGYLAAVGTVQGLRWFGVA